MSTTTKTKKKRRARVPKRRTPGVPAATRALLQQIPGYDPFRDADGYTYNAELGETAVLFFERVLTHVKGPLGKKPFLLEAWQKAVLMNLWGWRDTEGHRRYRRFLIYVPKKNGKTPMAAGLILLMLATDHEPGAEIVGAAAAKEQAAYIFEQAVGMVRNSPLLQKRLRVYGGNGGAVQRRIVNEAEGSVYRVVSADANIFDGANLHGAVIDELHRQPGPEFADLIESSDTARHNSLIGSITTADYWRPESACNRRHKYACEVRDGVIRDARFLPVIYEASPDDDWTAEATWRKANPNYGVSVNPEAFAALVEKAKREPSFTNTFKRLYLDIVTDTHQVWVPGPAWERCGPGRVDVAERDTILARFEGAPCWLGVDLSSKIDLSCVHQVWYERLDGQDHYYSVPWFFAPRDRAHDRERTDHVPYIEWANRGWLTLTPGDVIDYAWIEKHVLDTLGARCEIREVGYDPWNAMQFALRLQAAGVAVVEVRQGYGSLSEPSKLWEAMVTSGRWHHDGNPVMSWCVANAMHTSDAAGNIKPDKEHSTERIDGVAALVTGLARAMISGGDGASVYESEGLTLL